MVTILPDLSVYPIFHCFDKCKNDPMVVAKLGWTHKKACNKAKLQHKTILKIVLCFYLLTDSESRGMSCQQHCKLLIALLFKSDIFFC